MIRNTDDPTDSFVTQPLKGLIWPILLLTTIFFVNFIARIALAPMMPEVVTNLSISHTEAGSLFLFISIGYFTSLLGSGFLNSYWSHKKTITVSMLSVGLALFFIASSQGIWSMRLGLLLLGIASGPYIPSGMATLTSLTTSRHFGKVIGIHELAPNLAFIVVPLAVEAILAQSSWRTVFIAIGAAALISTVVFARFGRGGDFTGQTPSIDSMKALISNPSFGIMVVLFSLGISGTLGLFTMLPLYLVTEHGFDRSWANTLIAVSRIASLCIVFFSGWTTDRFGTIRVLRIVFLLSGLLTFLLGIIPSSMLIPVIILQPVVAVCFFPAGLAALSMITSPSERNITVSLTVPLGFLIGGGVTPALIGFFGDVGSFGTGIALVGGLFLAGAVLPGYLSFYHEEPMPPD